MTEDLKLAEGLQAASSDPSMITFAGEKINVKVAKHCLRVTMPARLNSRIPGRALVGRSLPILMHATTTLDFVL